jgi:hypothetical protein
MKCVYCDEPLSENDANACNFVIRPEHWECGFRAIMGSVAHIEQRCGCYVPGSTDHDPPNMTKREAARAAVAAWNKLHSATWQ